VAESQQLMRVAHQLTAAAIRQLPVKPVE